jgi:CubicO group peptidase (beta-lactamase class C family)
VNRLTRLLPILLLGLVADTAGAVPAHQPVPGASPVPIPEGAGLKTPEELETFLDGVITAQLQAQNWAGVTVSVVKDGKLFFAKGYGYADVDKRIPVDAAKTLFRPGSISKLFTWTALMQLVEQGKVGLDDDVNKHISQFQVPYNYPDKPVTLRHLLTHSGGLEDSGLVHLFVKTADRMDAPAQALARLIPAQVREPASGDFSNGDMSSYSNWGTALAGLIVANVSGMSYDDYLEKHILEPLDMTRSTPRQPLPAALAGDMSLGYSNQGGRLKAGDFEFVNLAPAGSMSATATDMAKFMIAHLQKGAYGEHRILKEETANLMQARALSLNPHTNGACLGFYENWVNGRRLIVHGGDTGAFHSEMNLLPQENVGFFVSVNTAGRVPAYMWRPGLLRAFMDRYYPADLPAVKPPADFKERIGRYAGSYRIIRHSYTTFEKVASVLMALSVAPTDRDTLLLSFGPWTYEIVEVAPDVFRRVDSDDMIAFSVDASGQAQYVLNPLSLPNHPAYRIAGYETPVALGFIAGLALLFFLVAIVSALRHWQQDRAAAAGARRARRGAALVGAIHLAFLIAVVIVSTALTDQPVDRVLDMLRAVLVLPMIAAVLTLALIGFAWAAWKNGYWTRYARVQYTLIVGFCALFLWLLNYVNLLGWKFG